MLLHGRDEGGGESEGAGMSRVKISKDWQKRKCCGVILDQWVRRNPDPTTLRCSRCDRGGTMSTSDRSRISTGTSCQTGRSGKCPSGRSGSRIPGRAR